MGLGAGDVVFDQGDVEGDAGVEPNDRRVECAFEALAPGVGAVGLGGHGGVGSRGNRHRLPYRNWLAVLGEPVGEGYLGLVLGGLASGEVDEGAGGVGFGGGEFDAVDGEEGVGGDEGDAFVAVDEAVVFGEAVAIGGCEVVEAGVGVVAVEVAGFGEGGVEAIVG
jgi:hypothetical protein